MKIWGRATSSNVQKVLWVADEIGLKYDHESVGGSFGRNDQQWYLDMNPNGRIPVIDDDGFIVWESNSAVRYLTAKHAAGSLWPTDLTQRSEADRWMDWELGTFVPPMRVVFWQLIRTPAEKRDSAAIKAAADEAAKLMGRLDGWLEGRKFIAGEHFTMGDIPVGCLVYRWFELDIEPPALKNVRAWYDRLLKRPGYAKWVAVPMS